MLAVPAARRFTGRETPPSAPASSATPSRSRSPARGFIFVMWAWGVRTRQSAVFRAPLTLGSAPETGDSVPLCSVSLLRGVVILSAVSASAAVCLCACLCQLCGLLWAPAFPSQPGGTDTPVLLDELVKFYAVCRCVCVCVWCGRGGAAGTRSGAAQWATVTAVWPCLVFTRLCKVYLHTFVEQRPASAE